MHSVMCVINGAFVIAIENNIYAEIYLATELYVFKIAPSFETSGQAYVFVIMLYLRLISLVLYFQCEK